MRPDVTYPKCQCTKPGIWKLWISKKKGVCGLLLLGMGFGEEKNTPTKECFFLVFSQENMTLLYRSVIIKNKSFIYTYMYSYIISQWRDW